MCGILALASVGRDEITLDMRTLVAMRDRLAHRGPDDAGALIAGNVAIAHRRLSVIDPGPGGHQPMTTPDGRFTLSYNGELYNDADVRDDLCARGVRFQTACDSEAVLLALATWGIDALDRLRGMYALILHDARENTLLLARDPLGIKPLYTWQGSIDGRDSIIASSEIPAICAHPGVPVNPDPIGVEAYLTTIRTTIARRTMFEGISCLLPGERIHIDLDGTLRARSEVRTIDAPIARDITNAELREDIEGSVRCHLRSDVPMCCLLSGGVDSSIIAGIASRFHNETLRTYCAGARAQDGAESPDFAPARRVASILGTDHH